MEAYRFRQDRWNVETQRGTASVEAVVALPVLVLLFVGVFYVRDLATAKHDALTKARTCAWLYSANNCNEKPAGCEDILVDDDEGGKVTDKVAEALADGTDRITKSPGMGGAIEHIVSAMIEPALKAAFGRSVAANATNEVKRPALFGQGKQVVAGKYHLACNLNPSTMEDVVKDAWHLLRP
jgi:hypothetical protein